MVKELRTIKNINSLNRLYYCNPTVRMTGKEFRQVVKDRRVNFDYNDNTLEVFIHKTKWNVCKKTWNEFANIINELCLQDDLREHLVTLPDNEYQIVLDLKPLYIDDIDTIYM